MNSAENNVIDLYPDNLENSETTENLSVEDLLAYVKEQIRDLHFGEKNVDDNEIAIQLEVYSELEKELSNRLKLIQIKQHWNRFTGGKKADEIKQAA